MQRFRALAAGIIALLVVASASGQAQQSPEPAVLAKVGGSMITSAELSDYVERNHPLAAYSGRAGVYARALDEMVTTQLMRIDFFESGLHRDEALLQQIQRRIAEELVLEYFQTQYQEKHIGEAAIRAAYEDMGRRVVYKQIVLPKLQGASPRERESLEALLAEIRAQIAAGTDFGDLAERFSSDAVSARRAGYGEPLTWQMSLRNPRDYIIHNLDVGAVRVFEDVHSYQVVQVVRHEDVPRPPFGHVREEIQTALEAQRMPTAVAEFEREKREAVDSSTVHWNPEGLRQVVAWANTSNFFERDYRATLTEALAEGNDVVIMSHAGGTVDVAEFLRLLDGVLIMDRSGSHEFEVVQDFILEAVRTDVIARRARALGLEEVLMSADSPSTVLRNRFVTLYHQRAIEERVPEASDEALRAFYEAHRDSLFHQLAAATLYVLTRSDEQEAEALWDRVERGERFEDLTGRWLVRPFIRNRDGAIASASGTEPPALGALAFDLEEGEVRGPIAYEHPEGGTHHAIVKLNSRRDERPLRYEEVENTIAEAFTRHHRARIRADVEEDLRARYPVTIYRDLLERYIAEQ